MKDKTEVILQKIKEAELVLVGIGEKFDQGETADAVSRAYRGLAGLLAGKNYFVITVCTDELIYGAGLREDRIVRPLAEEEAEGGGEQPGEPKTAHSSRWELYLKWLQGTLNKKLLVLELGVGLQYPNVIRFPFEKMVYFNQKADFIRVHEKLSQFPAELGGRGVSVAEDAVALLADAEM